MKKTIILMLISLFSGTQLFAQQKTTGKAVISTPGMHCENCKERVEAFLGRMYGVTSVKADYKKKTVTVTWLTDRTDIEQIKTAIANRGYDADDVEAEETMVKRLPPACRKQPKPSVAVDSAKAQAD
ncbi:MAG TPA: heavy metal transporter [Chitinophagaceae bacterium]|nr:heavy metal transporter [Chitinophagaceae bacterium]HRF27208.1 heavy-metal-associated domain-containing protein [Ferruginibacter sp.]